MRQFVASFSMAVSFSSIAIAWTGEEVIDQMSDFKGWTAQNVSTDGSAILNLRCLNGRTDLLIITKHVLHRDLFGDTPVMIRFSGSSAERQSWIRSATDNAAFARDRISLARRLAQTNGSLLIRVQHSRTQYYDYEFVIDGGQNQIQEVATRCNWKITEPSHHEVNAEIGAGADDTEERSFGRRVTHQNWELVEAVLRYFVAPEAEFGTDNNTVRIEFFVGPNGKILDRPLRVYPIDALDNAHRTLELRALYALSRANEANQFANIAGKAAVLIASTDGTVEIEVRNYR